MKSVRSAIAEGPRDALCQLTSCQLLHSCTKKITLRKACSGWMTLKVIKGHPNWRYLIDRPYHFLLVACSNNDSILHRFWDNRPITFTVCDLRTSFMFEKISCLSSVKYLLAMRLYDLSPLLLVIFSHLCCNPDVYSWFSDLPLYCLSMFLIAYLYSFSLRCCSGVQHFCWQPVNIHPFLSEFCHILFLFPWSRLLQSSIVPESL